MKLVLAPTALLLSLVLVMAACGSDAPSIPDDEDPFHATALWIVVNDETLPFENGTAVTVGDLDVELFVAPFPPAREGSIDLYLTERDTGEPVDEGSLDVSFDMYMPHGAILAQALPSGGGHSLIPYKLVMPGEWRVDISIGRSSTVSQLSLVFEVS
jgi:hypothetical protein